MTEEKHALDPSLKLKNIPKKEKDGSTSRNVVVFNGEETKKAKLSEDSDKRFLSCSFDDNSVKIEKIHPDFFANVLNIEKKIDGFKFRACINCRNFRFSGLARQMSGGGTGYCWLRMELLTEIREERTNLVVKRDKKDEKRIKELQKKELELDMAATSVLASCADFEYGPKYKEED